MGSEMCIRDSCVEASQYVLDHLREFSHRMSLVSDDVQSVATAVDQMDSSISNISKNVDESSNYARAMSELADSAGEAGKGFTVVVDKVRQLAEGTESGARDVAMKVEEIQRSVGGLQRTSEPVCESFQHVLAPSDHIVTVVHQQSNASRDMSDCMPTVNSGLDRQVDDLKK